MVASLGLKGIGGFLLFFSPTKKRREVGEKEVCELKKVDTDDREDVKQAYNRGMMLFRYSRGDKSGSMR